jgi:exopolyphosphatase/pppGpp-phosphohydrolase
MLGSLSKKLSALRDTVNTSGALSDENAERMKTALTNFKENSAYGKHQ